jgi:small subunit ribosomal protein S17
MQNYNQRQHLLVHDPNSSLRTGDIISVTSGLRKAKHVKHIVKSIIAPFGEPIEARPPIPSIEEVAAEMDEKRAKKAERRNLRLQAEKEAHDAEKAQEMLKKGEEA